MTVAWITVELLKDKLRGLNLSTIGMKSELQYRLLRQFVLNREQCEGESQDESPHSDYADAVSGDSHENYFHFT